MSAISKVREPAKRGRRRQSRAMETEQRIVQCAILQFNQNGLRNVPLADIAKALKISPGNVTYYFKKKNDLIEATLIVLKDKMKAALVRPTAVKTAKDGVEYLLLVYRTLWEFRYFFNALTYVLTIPKLRKDYERLQKWTIEMMVEDMNQLCTQMIFLPMPTPNTHRLMAENMWSLWLSWLRIQQVRTPNAVTPDDAALYDCALHNWSLCQPVMNPVYAKSLLEEFRRALPLARSEF